MTTVLVLIAISLLAAGVAGWFVNDKLTTETKAADAALEERLVAQERRFDDWEKSIKKLSFEIGRDLQDFENKLKALVEDLEANYVSVQAIDNMNDEFFSLKTAVEAMGGKKKKKKKTKFGLSKKASKRR